MIILRHDVDDAFSTRNSFLKGMNYFRMNIGKYFPVWKRFGYLLEAQKLFEREREIGIQSSWFFRTITRPFPELREELLAEGHEIGFHADRIENENFFKKDLEYVVQSTKIFGFTKHGSSGLHTPRGVGLGEVYNPSLYIKRTKSSGFLYFCGNDVSPIETPKIADGVAFFPSVFWVFPGYMNDEKFTVEWLVAYQKDHDVVVLVHPQEATRAFPRIARKVENIYSRCEEIVSFKRYLETKRLL